MTKWLATMLLVVLTALTGITAIAENTAPSGGDFLYADGWLYRIHIEHGETYLIRTRNDGTEAQLVSQGHGIYYFFSVVGDTVYYLGTEKELGGFDTRMQVRSVNTDGTNDHALTGLGEYTSLFATDTHVYVKTEQGLTRYLIDPWGEVGQIKLSASWPHYEIADGWLYYPQVNGSISNIERINVENGKTETFLSLNNEEGLEEWTVEGKFLYYCLEDNETAQTHVMRKSVEGGRTELITIVPVAVQQFADGWAYGHQITPGEMLYGVPSVEYGDAVRINLQTGEVEELGNLGPNSIAPAGDKIILYSYDEGQPILAMTPGQRDTQPFPEVQFDE